MNGVPSSDISNSNLQPGPRRPVRPLVAPAPVAQAPVVMAYRLPQELMLLVRAQQEIMVGPLEGGRALAPPPAELEEYLKLSSRQSVTNPAQIFTMPPSAPGAQPALLLALERICRHIDAYKMAHLSQEGRTILWVEAQFGEPALTSFQTVHQEARATESVSGIGQSSVLYRLLRGMIIMYDNPQARKEADRLLLTLTWQKSGVAATHALVNKIFKAHQALATSTVGRPVPTRVSALTWDDEFRKIEAILPPWALKVIKEHPDNFASREALFNTLYNFAPAEESVPQPLRPVRPGTDKIFQLTDDQCFPCYPADAEEEELEERWQAVLAQMPVEQRGLYALVMAKNGRPLECFRCGKNHRIAQCPEPPTAPEMAGQPAPFYRPRSTPTASMGMPARPAMAPVPYVRPSAINSLPDARYERMEGQLAALTTVMTGILAGQIPARSSPARLEHYASPVMALPLTQPAVLVGGDEAPEGYMALGTAQDGRQLWGLEEDQQPWDRDAARGGAALN